MDQRKAAVQAEDRLRIEGGEADSGWSSKARGMFGLVVIFVVVAMALAR